MGPRVKCLLVDDFEDNLLVLSALLRRDDVDLLTAGSGLEALELLLVHDVALALLDVQMPDMDGFQLAELMRGSERTRHVPIIFVTAGSRDERRLSKGYETGAVDFLFKPIDPNVLRNKAEVFFQIYRQKQLLAQQLGELTETLRLNELFMGVLGHDLRNPLNAILMTASLIRLSTTDDAVSQQASRIQSSGERMQRMIEDILDVTRVRLGQGMPIKRQFVDLAVLIQPIILDHQCAQSVGRIELTTQGNLTGNWDPDRLAQAISNLIGNALQHGRDDEPITVLIDGSDTDHVELTVINSGGVAPELVPSLFDPFRGGQRGVGRSGGLGLGLYIVQQIIEAHQGRVDLSADDPDRTELRITLPRAELHRATL